MAKTANQLIKETYEIARDMPPAQGTIVKELAAILDVSNVALRQWICPYISRHLLSLNPLLARCRRYSRGER